MVAGEKQQSFIERARRTQIVQAAVDTIAELGYGRASFARIARRAGISPALISYHFASKDELIDQIVTDVTAAMNDAILAEVSDAPTYGAALRGLIETQVRYFASHPAEVIALGQIMAQSTGGERSAPTSREQHLADLEEMFRKGQADGELRAFDPRPMARTLLAALEAVPGELLTHPETDAEAYGRELADIFDAATRARG